MANNTNWLNVAPMSGNTGETTLSLTALTNDTLSAKTATVSAHNDTYNVTGTTTVTLKPFEPTLELSRSTLRFDSTGGTATFTVYSNTAWTISFPALVHSYSVSAGTGDTEVTVILSENLDEVSKVDVGIVKDCFNINQLYLTVVQESFIVQLDVYPTDDIVFDATGSSSSITIECNADWEIEYPSWVRPSVTSGGSGSKVVILTAGENGPNNRRGQVIVYAGSKSVAINVSQPFYIEPYIAVTPSALTFSYSADSTYVTVNSYPGWSAEVISAWETHWGDDIVLTLTVETPVDNVTISNLGQANAIVNGVVVPGTSYTLQTKGTYTIMYPFVSESLPVVSGVPYVTNVEISTGVTTIPAGCFAGMSFSSITIPSNIATIGSRAFSGCANLSDIYVSKDRAPQIEADTFRDIRPNGTLHYPAGSNYSTWLSGDKYYLGYYYWNGLTPSDVAWILTVSYNVTSTTAPTKIVSNSYYVKAIKDEQTGVITYLPDGHSYNAYNTYTFSQTGKQDLSYLMTSGNSSMGYGIIQFDSGTVATDLIYNYIPGKEGFKVQLDVKGAGNTLTGVTLNMDGFVFSYTGGSGNGSVTRMLPSVKKVVFGPQVHWLTKSQGALNKLSNLREVYMDQSGIQSFPVSTFSGNTNMSAITLPSVIKKIPRACFRDCDALLSVNVPEGVTSIVAEAFIECASLSAITLPSTLTNLKESPFSNNWNVFGGYQGLPSLQEIWCYALEPPATSGTGSASTFSNVATGGTFYCPSGTSGLYRDNPQFNWLFSGYSWNVSEISTEDYGIRASKKKITAPPSGNVETLTISSLYPWVASVNRKWVSLSQTTGESGRSVITVTVDSSVVPIEREATITIDNGQATFVVTVEQTFCKPLVLKRNTGLKNNAGEGPVANTNGYLFDSGVTVVNNCDYDFTGIKSIYRGIYSGVSGEAVPEGPVAVFGSASGYTNCGMTGCLKTLTEVEVDIPDVTYITWPFGNYNQACKTLTAVTFTSTDKVYTFRGAFNGLTNLKRVKLGNLSNAKFKLSTTYGSDHIFGSCSALTDLEIEALPDIDLNTIWSFADCPALTQQSLLNVLNALPVTTNSRKITLGSTNKAKLSEEQLAIATNKGWTIN